jgi:hypothetical protein
MFLLKLGEVEAAEEPEPQMPLMAVGVVELIVQE